MLPHTPSNLTIDDILASIRDNGFYLIPLGFLYEPDQSTISNIEKQVRIKHDPFTPPASSNYLVEYGHTLFATENHEFRDSTFVCAKVDFIQGDDNLMTLISNIPSYE